MRSLLLNVLFFVPNIRKPYESLLYGAHMPAAIDRVGMIYGYLTVLKPMGRNNHGKMLWLCSCKCGNTATVNGNSLVSGETKSCGCKKSEALAARFSEMRNEIVGKVFNYLTVLEYRISASKEGTLLCRCECGSEKVYDAHTVKSGSTKSCGCHNRKVAAERMTTHGLRDHPLYACWAAAKTRCGNPNYHASADYLGRGITMCVEWFDAFESFYSWAIANGWKPGLTLERRNVNEGYHPGNCTFATRAQQSQNRRCNVVRDMPMANSIRDSEGSCKEIADKFGIRVGVVRSIKSGKSWKVPPNRGESSC